jgi:uncharacterized protein YbbC (DUF1343 family)
MDRRALIASGLALFAAAGASTPAIARQGAPVVRPGPTRLGIDVLAADRFAALRGLRVGMITNQTGVNGNGTLSRVALQRAIGRRLVSLFGPEHGMDTRVRAGERVANSRDSATGLPVWSLYGATRMPTPEMVAGLDALVFDIQDIGVRSYTYISTMALAMEAAGAAGKRFFVLDRPNPLSGARVQGPPLEPRWQSFVSQVPVPYVHGLTIGEMARMMTAEGWIATPPRLDVIGMQGWRRSMDWGDTGLSWVATSPNIPNAMSPFYCAVTGLLGELRGVDIGINTPQAFKVAAAEGVDGARLAADLTAM